MLDKHLRYLERSTNCMAHKYAW